MLEDEQARDFARRQIHSDVFNAAFGTEAANQVLARGDVQIQAALELFDRAGELLAMRHEMRGFPAERLATSVGGPVMQGQADDPGGGTERPE